MKRLAAYILIVIFTTISVVPAQESAEQEELAKKVKEMQKEVSKICGKDFKKDVPVGVKDTEELKKFLLEEIEKKSSDEEIIKSQKVIEKFGLLQKGTDLKKIFVDVCTEQVAGLYDPEKKELFLMKGKGFGAGAAEDDMAAAHELTHALQDQYFDLLSFIRSVRNDDDESLAREALVEGEATLLGFRYVLLKGERFTRERADSALNKAPAIVRELLIFPYVRGALFCQQILRRSGWKGFDSAFENPPLSTEQILHPEKYFETTDYPTALKMPELLKQFEGDWQLLDTNSLGEFVISVLVSQFLTAGDAKKASEGWDGDKYQALEEKKTGKIVIAWVSTWDTKEDAQEFAKLYASVLAKKYNKKSEAAHNASFIFISGDSELACVESCGTEVIVVDSVSKAQLEKIRPELLKTVKVISNEQKLDEFAKQPFSVPAPPAEESKKEPQKKPEHEREF
jgi:hypothetical protein